MNGVSKLIFTGCHHITTLDKPNKIYTKSSSWLTVSGDDLFRGNRILRESLGFNATCTEPFKEVFTDSTVVFSEGLKGADIVLLVEFSLEETDSRGFLCQDNSKGFWFRSCLNLGWFSFPSSPCIFGFTFDSTGTSFPSTWFVKTNVTWNNRCIQSNFPPK